MGPLESAALADGESGPRGGVLPLPVDGEDPTVATLKADLRNLGGKLAFVESVRTMQPGAAGSSPQEDWKPRRIGANPPTAEVELLTAASVEVLNACGCSPGYCQVEADGRF